MIKIIDSGYGLRLLYDDIEVFNHTNVLPFLKAINASEHYKRRNGLVCGTVDIDGEFTLDTYVVKSASIKSANIEFSGYNGKLLKISVVEEKDRLALYFYTTLSIKFNFIVGLNQAVKVNDKVLSNVSSNVKQKEIGLFQNAKENATIITENSIGFSDHVINFSSDGLIKYKLEKRACLSVSCVKCPKCLYIIKIQK